MEAHAIGSGIQRGDGSLLEIGDRYVVIVQEDCAALTTVYTGNTPRSQVRLRVVLRR